MVVSPFSISVPVSSFQVPWIGSVVLGLLSGFSLHAVRHTQNKMVMKNFSIVILFDAEAKDLKLSNNVQRRYFKCLVASGVWLSRTIFSFVFANNAQKDL